MFIKDSKYCPHIFCSDLGFACNLSIIYYLHPPPSKKKEIKEKLREEEEKGRRRGRRKIGRKGKAK